MSILKEIKSYSQEAVRVLHQAGLQSDSDLRSLTREDLNELIPGPKNFQLRRRIFAIIDKHNTQKLQKPVNELLKELEGFIPRESFRAALTDNGVLVDYLHILKDKKKQMNDVQTFLDAHISLLEDIRMPQPEQKSDKGACSASHDFVKPHNENAHRRPHEEQRKGLYASGLAVRADALDENIQTNKHLQGIQTKSQYVSGLAVQADAMMAKNTQADKGAQRIPPKNTVMSPPAYYNEVTYKPVVCGKTFNAEAQLMGFVCSQVQDQVRITEWNPDLPDHQINIVFCPVSSRAGTDAEEALTNVKDNKPVILVLMHHIHQPKPVSSVRTCADFDNVVSYVNVFYHEAAHGLLKCNDNADAVTQIQNKLKEYMTVKATSVSTQDEIAESNETGGGDNVRGSPTDSHYSESDATAGNSMDSGSSIVSKFLNWGR